MFQQGEGVISLKHKCRGGELVKSIAAGCYDIASRYGVKYSASEEQYLLVVFRTAGKGEQDVEPFSKMKTSPVRPTMP